MNGMLTRSLESELGEVRPSSAKTIKISSRYNIWSVVDGKYVVGVDDEGKIRRWRVKDGMETRTPMDAGSWVCDIAVSRDGKWIVSGTTGGMVQAWNVENGEKATEVNAHSDWVRAVDVSPDSTRIASGSGDRTACVWSLSTGQRLLGPWEHDDIVFAVKFSPDGRFIATTKRGFSRIYDSRDGNLVVNVPIEVSSSVSESTRPLAQRFFNGPFRATNTIALHCQAMMH